MLSSHSPISVFLPLTDGYRFHTSVPFYTGIPGCIRKICIFVYTFKFWRMVCNASTFVNSSSSLRQSVSVYSPSMSFDLCESYVQRVEYCHAKWLRNPMWHVRTDGQKYQGCQCGEEGKNYSKLT